LCVWGTNLWETFGEDSPLATGIPATPATQMQPEDHLRALDRKVFERTPIPAMARARDGLATRTDSRVLTVRFHNPTLVRVEHAAKRHIAQIGEEICVITDLSSISQKYRKYQDCTKAASEPI
jgi:hypothetical protein